MKVCIPLVLRSTVEKGDALETLLTLDYPERQLLLRSREVNARWWKNILNHFRRKVTGFHGCRSRLTRSMNRSCDGEESTSGVEGVPRGRSYNETVLVPPLCAGVVHGSRDSGPNTESRGAWIELLLPGNFVVPSLWLTRDTPRVCLSHFFFRRSLS